MRRPAAAVTSLAWFTAVGGTFGCLLPYLLNYWHFHQPLPRWWIGQAAGAVLICGGMIPVAGSFIEFFKAGGTPVPAASPPRLVVSGFYRHLRNPIYAGFLAILIGQALLFGSAGLLEYTAVAWIIGAAAVRFYEEPVLTRKFGAGYQEYRRNVPAWIPRLQPWTPGERTRTRARTNAAPGHPPAITAKRALPLAGGKEHLVARIPGVPAQQAGPYARLVYYFTRRSLRQLTGRSPERMIEPLEIYAHVPGLLRGYAGLEQATARLSRLGKRTRALAELKAATVVQCEYCIDMGSQISRQWGLSDEELLALASHRTSALFSDLDKLVLDYAAGMSRTPVEVPDELFARLRAHFDEPQLVELTHLIALENLRGRFNLAFGVGAAGFSEGMACAVPATTPPGEAESR
jgi:AhpD family alkylhydroperoxidase